MSAGRAARPPLTLVSDSGNLLTSLGQDNSFDAPNGGVYTSRDCVSLSRPLPQVSSSAVQGQAQNVLACDSRSPDTHSQGVKLVIIPHAKLPEGPGKPRKPRASVKNNKSSFLSRGMMMEGFARRVFPGQDGFSSCLLVANFKRTLVLLDFDPEVQNRHEPLSKLFLATAWPLCMDWNRSKTSSTQLDLVIGTSSGDLLWLELASNRYQRVNKTGGVTKSPVTAVKWLPGSDSLVVAAHADGHVVIYDVITSEEGIPANGVSSNGSAASATMQVVVSSSQVSSRSVRGAYKIAGQQLTALDFFAPHLLAVACRDGFLRIIDLNREVMIEALPSFFAGLTDVRVSPDGRYFALASEDDEASVFDMRARKPLARLKGHAAWVNAVRFDPYFEDTQDPTALSIGTVGEDGTLMLWEFSPSTLVPPRNASHEIEQARVVGDTKIWPHVPQAQVPIVFPVAQITPYIAEFGSTPLTDLVFSSSTITVASSDGRLYTWEKPKR